MKQITQRKRCENAECDGEMVFTGMIFASYPPSNRHICTKCSECVGYAKIYPFSYTEYEESEKREDWE